MKPPPWVIATTHGNRVLSRLLGGSFKLGALLKVKKEQNTSTSEPGFKRRQFVCTQQQWAENNKKIISPFTTFNESPNRTTNAVFMPCICLKKIPSLYYHFVKTQPSGNSICRCKHNNHSFWWQTEITDNEYLQSAWRCISASGSSWVSGAGPCTVLLKRLPLFRFTKAKMEKKCIKSLQSLRALNQWVL